MHQLVKRYPIISDQIDKTELSVLLRELESILDKNIPGDIVEFGCYAGTASLFIQRVLMAYRSKKSFHVYDSFAGLPAKSASDISPVGEQFKAGELSASKSAFITNFRKAHLPLPIIHKAWFADLRPTDIPQQIAFAFLDGDFYESILQSLTLVWPKLGNNATVVVDDYQSTALPGAREAVDQWLVIHSASIHTEASLAIVHAKT